MFLQLILSLPQVEACAVGLHKGFRLLAFVVPSRNQPVQQQRDHPEEEEEEEKTDGTDSDLRRLILNQLSLLLPSHSVPDALLLIPALLLTPHGERHALQQNIGSLPQSYSWWLCCHRQSRHGGPHDEIPDSEKAFTVASLTW